MMKIPLFILGLSILLSQKSFANLTSFGLQCNGVDSTELKSCLKKEAEKIDEANLPNEIILTSLAEGKESLLKLVTEISSKRSDEYAQKLQKLIPLIESSVATALIIQYEDEPQLYYYVIDKNGKLEVIFDGINSVDLVDNFGPLFETDPALFYLKSSNVSKTFLEWLDFLKEN